MKGGRKKEGDKLMQTETVISFAPLSTWLPDSIILGYLKTPCRSEFFGDSTEVMRIIDNQ